MSDPFFTYSFDPFFVHVNIISRLLPRRQNADVTIFLPTISCLVVSTAKKHSTRPWSESQAPVQYVQQPRRQCTYIIYENGKVSLGSSLGSPTTGHSDLLLRDKNTKARRFVFERARHFCHEVINKRHPVIATVRPWLIHPLRRARL